MFLNSNFNPNHMKAVSELTNFYQKGKQSPKFVISFKFTCQNPRKPGNYITGHLIM